MEIFAVEPVLYLARCFFEDMRTTSLFLKNLIIPGEVGFEVHRFMIYHGDKCCDQYSEVRI